MYGVYDKSGGLVRYKACCQRFIVLIKLKPMMTMCDGDDNAQKPELGEGSEGVGGEAGGEGAEVEAGDGEGDGALVIDWGAFVLCWGADAINVADAGDGAGEAGEGAGGDEHALAGMDGGCVGVGYGAQIGGEQPYGVLEAAHVGVGNGGVGGCG